MSRHQDPKLTAQASWFENKRRHRHHRHRHHRHKKKLRGLVKFIMPTIVVILAVATGWVVLKVFFLDKRAHRKAAARASAVAKPSTPPTTTNTPPPSRSFAAMDAEMFSYQSAIAETRAASLSKPGNAHAIDPILDPSEVVRSYSNRVAGDVRAAMDDALVAAQRAAARTSATGVVELDAGAVIQKLAKRPLVAQSPSPVATDLDEEIEQVSQPQVAGIESGPIDVEKASNTHSSSVESSATRQRDKISEAQEKFISASMQYKNGNLAGAELLCREVLEATPENHQAHNLLGEILVRRQKWEPAVPEFEKAVHGNPDNAEYQNNLGLLLSQLNQNDRAEEHLVKAYKIDPMNATILMNCCWHYRKLKRYPEALKYIEMVLALNPGNKQARSRRVQTLLDMGSYDRAEQLIHEEMTQAPQSILPQMMMAMLLVKRGDVDAAIGRLRQAEALTTRDRFRQILERVHDFDSIKDTPQYQDYLASLRQ